LDGGEDLLEVEEWRSIKLKSKEVVVVVWMA